MKNAFALTTVLYATAYAGGVGAQLAGLLSVDLLSLEAALGGYVAAGLLAIASHDYGRASRYREKRRRMPEPVRPAPVREAARSAAWIYRTSSA